METKLIVYETEPKFDVTGSYDASYLDAKVNRIPTNAEMEQLFAERKIVGYTVQNYSPDAVKYQDLLNHYQRDTKGYLKACEAAGLNKKKGEEFADEVKMLLKYSGSNKGDDLAWIWIFIASGFMCGGVFLIYKMLEFVFTVRLPQVLAGGG